MIEVKNVKFSYNSQDRAVKGVSFSVADHEWLSIIGHNGSGKSTLAKLLIGLIEQQAGTISYDSLELNETNVGEIRKRVGIVFQNPDNQFVGYNVLYDIAFGLENHLIPREEMRALIDEYIQKVDMKDYLYREPETLSGGQKQRVAIAGILAMNCDIIILDEATSMLDPQGTEEIISLIEELHTKYNKTIITITHDLALAEKSDRIIVMNSIYDGVLSIIQDPEYLWKEIYYYPLT